MNRETFLIEAPDRRMFKDGIDDVKTRHIIPRVYPFDEHFNVLYDVFVVNLQCSAHRICFCTLVYFCTIARISSTRVALM